MEEYNSVSEGKATVLYPKTAKVFYNPIQQFNRDISILAIRAWTKLYNQQNKKRKRDEPEEPKPFITIVEGLAASGLRSIRYGKEIPLVKKIYANDLSKESVESISRNSEFNQLQDIINPVHDDANATMYKLKGKAAHVVDLDPYGSAVPFLDSAIQCINDGGLLLVTCTDLAVLAGNGYPEKCFAYYGGTTVRNDATHESALRLVLNTVATTAAKYGKSITPLLSLSIDYYLRCFIQVRTAPVLVKENLAKSAVVYNCTGCQTTHVQPLGKMSEFESKKNRKQKEPKEDKVPQKQPKQYKFGYAKGPVISPFCEFCQNPHHMSGPLWVGPLHDNEFIDDMLEILPTLDDETYGTKARILGMLTLARQELEIPFYISPSNMASKVRCPVPSLRKFVSALLNGGYKASLTHAKAGCVKTDAPAVFLWDVLRAWARENKESSQQKESPGSNILKGEITHEISFEEHPDVEPIDKLRKSKIVCYQMNPRAEWGPMARPAKEKEV